MYRVQKINSLTRSLSLSSSHLLAYIVLMEPSTHYVPYSPSSVFPKINAYGTHKHTNTNTFDILIYAQTIYIFYIAYIPSKMRCVYSPHSAHIAIEQSIIGSPWPLFPSLSCYMKPAHNYEMKLYMHDDFASMLYLYIPNSYACGYCETFLPYTIAIWK